MVKYLVTSILMAIIVFTIYTLFDAIILIPSSKSSNSIKAAKVNRKENEKFFNQLIRPLVKVISKFIYISDDKYKQMDYRLKKANINLDPKTYEATCIAKSLFIVIFSILFFPVGLGPVSIILVMLSILYYVKQKIDVKEVISDMQDAILYQLPDFARYYFSNIKSQNNTIQILKAYYKKGAGDALKYELGITLSEMTTSDISLEKSARIKALEDMDLRINIPSMSDLISGIIATEKGEDKSIYFEHMEKDMADLAKIMLKKKIKNAPKNINRAGWIVLGAALLMVLVAFGLNFADSMNLFI